MNILDFRQYSFLKFRNSRNLHVIAIIAQTRIIKMVPKDNVSVNPRIVEIVNY